MKIVKIIKFLVKARKPAKDVINQAKEIKRGYKSLEFWISLVGSLSALGASLTGLIEPTTGVLVTVGLATLYNVLRGVKKASEDGTRPVMASTEFWIGLLGIIQTGLIEIKTKGVDGEWLVGALAIIGGGMAMAQNIASIQPGDISDDATPK